MTITQLGLSWQKVKDGIDDSTIHRGTNRVFLITNSIDLLEQINILMVITRNFVERRYEDAFEQRHHQAKGMMKQRLLEPRIRHKLEIKLVV